MLSIILYKKTFDNAIPKMITEANAALEPEKVVKAINTGELTKCMKWGKISKDNVIIYIAAIAKMDGGIKPWKG